MVNPAVIVPEDQPLTLATLPPSRAQRRLALGVVLASLVAFSIMAGPLSTFQLRRIDAFVPTYGTAILVKNLIAAVLLFNQFAILRSRASLAIANGYLFAGLMVIPWLLTFPGVFAPGGLLGAGLQSTAWLSALRYLGFPAFVIAYGPSEGCRSAQAIVGGLSGRDHPFKCRDIRSHHVRRDSSCHSE
jgi:Membrane-associated sensor, integral membrane domain